MNVFIYTVYTHLSQGPYLSLEQAKNKLKISHQQQNKLQTEQNMVQTAKYNSTGMLMANENIWNAEQKYELANEILITKLQRTQQRERFWDEKKSR